MRAILRFTSDLLRVLNEAVKNRFLPRSSRRLSTEFTEKSFAMRLESYIFLITLRVLRASSLCLRGEFFEFFTCSTTDPLISPCDTGRFTILFTVDIYETTTRILVYSDSIRDVRSARARGGRKFQGIMGRQPRCGPGDVSRPPDYRS